MFYFIQKTSMRVDYQDFLPLSGNIFFLYENDSGKATDLNVTFILETTLEDSFSRENQNRNLNYLSRHQILSRTECKVR